MIVGEPPTSVSTFPLRALRISLGMSAKDVMTRGGEITRYFPKDPEGVLNIERRGTLNFHIIRALATIYGRSIEEIGEIAKPASPHTN